MAERDFIIGDVMHVLDGKSFRMAVTRIGRNNRDRYSGEERIHIRSLKPAEIVSITGVFEKPVLERVLIEREVVCLIHSRTEGGQLAADVYIVQ